MDRSELVQLILDYCSGKIGTKQKTFNDGKYIVLGKYCVPHDALTPLKIYGKNNEYYSVECLINLWQNKDEIHTNYVKKAAAAGLKPVTKVDKREMVEYLSGKVLGLPSFYDYAWIPVFPIPVSRFGQHGEPAAKKIKTEIVDDYSFTQSDVPLQLQIKEEPMEHGSRRLEISKDPGVEIRALSDVLTSEKILQLKRKKQLNQKMKKIANVEKDIFDLFGDNYIPKKAGFEEVTYADRESVMQSRKMVFTNLFELLNEMQITDRKIRLDYEPSMEVPQRVPVPMMPRYDRYDQEVFVQEDVSAFQSFVGQDFKNLGAVMSAAAEEEQKATKPEPPPIFPRHPVARRPVAESVPRTVPKKVLPTLKKINGAPIIIIPVAGNMSGTLINMYNAADILENLRFVEPTQRKAEGAKNETQILIRRQFNNRKISYRVIDNPLRLKSDEWDRVVAVFVMGPLWQFKGWKWNGNPVEIFTHIPAFHLFYEDLSMDKNVARLNVTPIPISRHKRHLDRSRLIKFWEIVDRHIMKTFSYRRH